MLVGILSDTHGYYHPALDDVLSGVDLILHAGDVGTLRILHRLERLAPVHAVWGNVDSKEVRFQTLETVRLCTGGLSFWMTHIAGHPRRWQRNMGNKLAVNTPNVFVCGHSHILRIERVAVLDHMLFINPGAAGREGLHREKTCVRLCIENDKATKAEVVTLDSPPETLP